MRAIHVSSPGNDYTLELRDNIAPPTLAEQDVLIKVAAAGVNRADIYQAQGSYDAPEGVSGILGLEVSGTIVAMGGKVRSHAMGNKVCALLLGGGYADYVAVPEWRVLPVPDGITMMQAAVIPEVAFTCYQALMECARLQPGETVLIHGGASGIGTFAIQLAKAFGATVYATAGNEDKVALCEKLGALRAINYQEENFVELVKKMTGGKGVNVILDMVGGKYFQKNLKMLAMNGRMVSIAFIEGATAEINMASLLMKNLTWQGFTLRSRTEEQIYNLAQSVRSVVWPLLEEKKIRMMMDKAFPLSEAQKAHKRMLGFSHMGKIVLVV